MKKIIFYTSVLLGFLLFAHSEISPIWLWPWYAEKVNGFSLAHPMAMGIILFLLLLNALCLGAYCNSTSETKVPA